MEIVKAKDNDLIEILYLLKVCISDMHRKGLRHWNSAYPDAVILQNDLREGSVYLLKDRRVCKGMMTLSGSEPEVYRDIEWPNGCTRPLYLHRMVVHPKWQGMGFARQLIGFAGDYAREKGHDCIRLDVFSYSKIARRLYEKNDFLEIGTFHMDEQKIPYVCYEKQI